MEKIVRLKKSDTYTEFDKRLEAAVEKANETYEKKVVRRIDYSEEWFERLADLLDDSLQDPQQLTDPEKKARREKLILAAKWLESFGYYCSGAEVGPRMVSVDMDRYGSFRGPELLALRDLVNNADDVSLAVKPDGGARLSFMIEGT